MAEANKDALPKIDGLPDSRSDSRADNLLNTMRTRTRSGHYIEYNDNEGVEHLTFQHRSGSMVQMQADGSVRFVSQNGKMGFEITGEGYVRVTGAYNIVATGDVTVRAQNLDFHSEKNTTFTVGETFTVLAKNMAASISEKLEMTSGSTSLRSRDNSVFTSGGKLVILGTNKVRVWSATKTSIVGPVVNVTGQTTTYVGQGDDYADNSQTVGVYATGTTTVIGKDRVDINP